MVARFPSDARIDDISPTDLVLVALGELRTGSSGCAGRNPERICSWLDYPIVHLLSIDGRALLFTESGEGVRGTFTMYLRKTDGSSPPVRLGEGLGGWDLSGDLKWVLARRKGVKSDVLLGQREPGNRRW